MSIILQLTEEQFAALLDEVNAGAGEFLDSLVGDDIRALKAESDAYLAIKDKLGDITDNLELAACEAVGADNDLVDMIGEPRYVPATEDNNAYLVVPCDIRLNITKQIGVAEKVELLEAIPEPNSRGDNIHQDLKLAWSLSGRLVEIGHPELLVRDGDNWVRQDQTQTKKET
jgi:hypothetical protein